MKEEIIESTEPAEKEEKPETRLDILKGAMWFLGIAIIGGAVTFTYLCASTEFNCTRTSDNKGSCQYMSKSLFGKTTENFQLANIKNIEVKREEKESTGKGISKHYVNYYVLLHETDGNIFNISGGNDLQDKTSYANEINSFIKDRGKKKLNAKNKDNNIGLSIIGIIITLFGLSGFLCYLYFAFKPR